MTTPLTWLGHAAFRLDTPSGTRIYVDPWLLGNPTCPASEREPERCDLILLTHGHGDHVGDAVTLHQRFGCPVVAQVVLRGWLTGQGVADDGMAHSINKGGTVQIGDVAVTLTTANHSSSAPDGTYLGESCGMVLTIEDGPTITAIRERHSRGIPPEDAQIVNFTRELIRKHRVDDTTVKALQARFGNEGFIELSGAIGYYSMLAMTVNACELEAAPGAEVLQI